MKVSVGYLVLMGGGAMFVLTFIGGLGSSGDAAANPYASNAVPTEWLWGIGFLCLMGFNTLARFLVSDLPQAGSWLMARRPTAWGVIACLLLGGFLFLG